jgi:hypothetical protein
MRRSRNAPHVDRSTAWSPMDMTSAQRALAAALGKMDERNLIPKYIKPANLLVDAASGDAGLRLRGRHNSGRLMAAAWFGRLGDDHLNQAA